MYVRVQPSCGHTRGMRSRAFHPRACVIVRPLVKKQQAARAMAVVPSLQRLCAGEIVKKHGVTSAFGPIAERLLRGHALAAEWEQGAYERFAAWGGGCCPKRVLDKAMREGHALVADLCVRRWPSICTYDEVALNVFSLMITPAKPREVGATRYSHIIRVHDNTFRWHGEQRAKALARGECVSPINMYLTAVVYITHVRKREVASITDCYFKPFLMHSGIPLGKPRDHPYHDVTLHALLKHIRARGSSNLSWVEREVEAEIHRLGSRLACEEHAGTAREPRAPP